MNEPTPEEIAKVIRCLQENGLQYMPPSQYMGIAKWHLAHLAQVTKERDSALKQAEVYRKETHRWSKADKKAAVELNRLRRSLDRIAQYPVHSEPMGCAMDMRDIASKALNP